MGKWSDFVTKIRKPFPPDDKPANCIEITPGSGDKSTAPPVVQKGTWLSRWRPRSKRDRQIAWLQAGYSETLDLLRAIRQHLDRQEDVQVKMANVLDRLPESMEGLKSVNKAAEQQVVILGLLRQQIEAGVQHDQKLVESMNKFNETLGLMDETSRNSGRTVTDLIEKAKNSESLLREVIERSERRVVWVTTLFGLVIVLAATAFLYFGTGDRGLFATKKFPTSAYSIPALTAPTKEREAVIEEALRLESVAVTKAAVENDQPQELFNWMLHRKKTNGTAKKVTVPEPHK
jgi:hypothetical protein